MCSHKVLPKNGFRKAKSTQESCSSFVMTNQLGYSNPRCGSRNFVDFWHGFLGAKNRHQHRPPKCALLMSFGTPFLRLKKKPLRHLPVHTPPPTCLTHQPRGTLRGEGIPSNHKWPKWCLGVSKMWKKTCLSPSQLMVSLLVTCWFGSRWFGIHLRLHLPPQKKKQAVLIHKQVYPPSN